MRLHVLIQELLRSIFTAIHSQVLLFIFLHIPEVHKAFERDAYRAPAIKNSSVRGEMLISRQQIKTL
jgi:hypothetical protein